MCIQLPLWLSQFVSDHSAGLGITAVVALYFGMWAIIPVRY